MENKLPLPQAKPEEVGMSAERLARIRPALQSFYFPQSDSKFRDAGGAGR